MSLLVDLTLPHTIENYSFKNTCKRVFWKFLLSGTNEFVKGQAEYDGNIGDKMSLILRSVKMWETFARFLFCLDRRVKLLSLDKFVFYFVT